MLCIGGLLIIVKKYKGQNISFQIDIDCPIYADRAWNVAKRGSIFYLYDSDTNKYYHRLVMGEPKGLCIDHINRDSTDNRLENLRVVSQKDNSHNMSKTKFPTTSKYKGVSWESYSRKWKAAITINYKQITIGRFNTEEDAAVAYNNYIDLYRPKYGNKNIL